MNALSTPETLQQSLQARLRERLSDQDVADFQRDGVVCIRQLLSPDEVALLRDGIDANLATPSPRAKVASRPDDPGRFFEDFCNWQDIPQFGRLVQESHSSRILGCEVDGHRLSAIQRTTAAGICAALDLVAQGKLPQQGFVGQEQVALTDFLANRFGSAYQQSRQVESIG